MEYYDSNNKLPVRYGLIATAIYIVLLAVLMFTIRFTVSVTEPSEQGILVEFGESLEAQGEEELAATDVAATPPPPQVEQEADPIETDPTEEIALEQEEIETKPKSETPQVEQPIEQPDTIIPEPRVANQAALFPGRKEQSTETSQGNSQGAGNQGSESGGESGVAVGGGTGDEPMAQLKDRSIVGTLPKPVYSANSVGRVVVEIVVDDAGYVKSASYRAQGSTTNDEQLTRAAEAAARKARFTPSESKVVQSGTITYIFKMN